MAGVVTAPFCGRPFGMVADPLGDIGLRGHHALLDRTVEGELEIFFLTIGRIGDGADRQDDLDHSQCPLSETKLKNVTPNSGSHLEFRQRISRSAVAFGSIASS